MADTKIFSFPENGGNNGGYIMRRIIRVLKIDGQILD